MGKTIKKIVQDENAKLKKLKDKYENRKNQIKRLKNIIKKLEKKLEKYESGITGTSDTGRPIKKDKSKTKKTGLNSSTSKVKQKELIDKLKSIYGKKENL
jgi:chromosome segregation ATPase